MDATTIVDVITGADAAATVDAATAVAAEPVFLAAVPPAAAFSGSSFLCAAAEITDMAIATVDAEMVITVDADSVPVRAYQAKKQRIISSAFACLFLHFALFLSAVFSVYFSDIPCPVHKKHFHPVPVFLFCRPYGSYVRPCLSVII